MSRPHQPAAREVPFDAAAPLITDLAAAARLSLPGGEASRPLVVGITGPVGAGKSTLADRLSRCIIATDHYLPDYDLTAEPLRDLPEHSDLPRLAADLESLRGGHPTSIPRWCFQVHKRIGEQAVIPAALIVVEGLHALHATVAPALDIRVYVDAPRAVRWARWEHLESTGQRGWGVEVARRFFANVAEPTFGARAAEYRAGAHVLVINDRFTPSNP